MRYYDHYHDPSTHLELTRQWEDELLRQAARRGIWSAMLPRLRARLRRVPAQRDPGAAGHRLGDVGATVHRLH